MKRTYIITLLLSLCSLFTYAQESFFDKYADMEGVTSVYISKAMLSLMPDMKTEEIYIGELASKLDNIQILNCEKASVTAQIKKDISYISPKNGYQELIRINDEGEKVTIFQKQNEGKQKEFVLLCEEQNELTIIILSLIHISEYIIPTICVKHDLYLSLFKHFCRKKIRKYVPKRSLKTFPKQ